MADYYTQPESDARYAPMDHDHNLEELGGTELPASRVAVPEDVSASFDDAFTVDEALASIAGQMAGKASSNHTHTGYAAASHTHAGYAEANHEHTGYAETEHTHTEYAPASHGHTGYADSNHTHTPASIGAAPATHSHDYAAPTHSHAQSDITGLADALAAKADASAMSGKADLVDGKVPASQLPSYVDDVIDGTLVNATTFNVNGAAVTPEGDKIYNDTTSNKSYRWSGTQFVALNEGVVLGETSATAYRGDRGKTAYDHSQNGNVHVTTAQKSAWDSKAAGDHTHTPASIGAAAASHTHDYAASGHTHAYADLTGKPTIPDAYSHPASHPASMITGLATVATSGKYSDLSEKPTALPANGGDADTVDGKHASEFATADHTHAGWSGGSASTYKLVYVGTAGSDDNAGSSSAPMATVKGAIRKYAEKHKFLDIRLLDGTYNEDIGAIGTDVANLSIRSVSENKDAVTINMATQLDLNSGTVRLYNMTLNVTATGVRGISVNAGALYAYGLRINVPTGSTISCVNVYNGTQAFLMNCVLNAGTGTSAGAAVYGNQALLIKAINCTSERKNNVGVHAHNGSDIWYTDTINATTKTKQTSWGKCTLRS